MHADEAERELDVVRAGFLLDDVQRLLRSRLRCPRAACRRAPQTAAAAARRPPGERCPCRAAGRSRPDERPRTGADRSRPTSQRRGSSGSSTAAHSAPETRAKNPGSPNALASSAAWPRETPRPTGSAPACSPADRTRPSRSRPPATAARTAPWPRPPWRRTA